MLRTLPAIVRRTAAVLPSFVTLLLVGTSAYASGDGGHGEEGHSAAAWLTLAFTFVNFGIFLYLMRRFTSTPLRDYLTTRRQTLEEAIFAASKAKEEAEAARKEYETKIAEVANVRTQIIADMRASAENQREQTLADAREGAERLIAEARRTADSDLERARGELRAEAARLAAELARADVESRITSDDKRRLVAEFVEAVQQS